jgi:hypothetical protein
MDIKRTQDEACGRERSNTSEDNSVKGIWPLKGLIYKGRGTGKLGRSEYGTGGFQNIFLG